MSPSSLSVARFFQRLRDPRREHRKRHLLLDIIAITLCAVIAGADDWQQVAAFAQRRQDWLQGFLRLPNGIPSHDTFERVFDRLDPQAFQACFQHWVEALAGSLGLGHIAIDGKTLRHSGNKVKGWKALHMVSAWAAECHLSLGEVTVDEKSNEITAIPRLLELLDLKGALATIDAMGCQKAIAQQIVAGGGDYVLAVKENQPHLLEDIQSRLDKALDGDVAHVPHDTYETETHGHGRWEKRSYVILTNVEGVRHRDDWADLRAIGMAFYERTIRGRTSEEIHYFIGSRVMPAKRYAEVLRGHWSIENQLHWHLDVTFEEDASRVQRPNAAENLALIRRMALGLLKRHAGKGSLACKRYTAALDPAFLEEILQSGDNLDKG